VFCGMGCEARVEDGEEILYIFARCVELDAADARVSKGKGDVQINYSNVQSLIFYVLYVLW